MTSTNQLLAGIARDHLHVPTLEARKSDSLDFHTVAVWSIREALDAAFAAGADSVRKGVASIDIDGLLLERRQIAVIWSVEDVQEVRSDLSDDQAWQVLQACDRRHDSEVGLTWFVIETVAADLFPKPTRKAAIRALLAKIEQRIEALPEDEHADPAASGSIACIVDDITRLLKGK